MNLREAMQPDRWCGMGHESSTGLNPARVGAIRSRPTASNSSTWVVVLAGGQGTRLQQFVRLVLGSDRPKQFCRIVGTRSMLRHTWDRAKQLVPSNRIVTVITAGQERYLEEEARVGRIPGSVLVQPANKETAPGLFLPLLWIASRDPDATAVVFPSDHFIWEETRFFLHVRAAVALAAQHADRLILLGVEPDNPEQGYGWIVPAARLRDGVRCEAYEVQRFLEKPDRPIAMRLYAQGCFWNTLVLAGRMQTYLRLAESAAPEVLTPLFDLAERLGPPLDRMELAHVYRRFPPTDLSRTLLTRCSEDLVLLAVREVHWSDWGDPERILRTLRRVNRRPGWLPVYARIVEAGGISS